MVSEGYFISKISKSYVFIYSSKDQDDEEGREYVQCQQHEEVGEHLQCSENILTDVHLCSGDTHL